MQWVSRSIQRPERQAVESRKGGGETGALNGAIGILQGIAADSDSVCAVTLTNGDYKRGLSGNCILVLYRTAMRTS